jgi:hypothetical protein
MAQEREKPVAKNTPGGKETLPPLPFRPAAKDVDFTRIKRVRVDESSERVLDELREERF